MVSGVAVGAERDEVVEGVFLDLRPWLDVRDLVARLAARVRGIQRVRLHADLTMLGRLSLALARARAVPLAA